MSERVHVGRQHLIGAFRTHAEGSESCENLLCSSMLLLVYAVECGLKALLLMKRGIHSTIQLDDDDFTHDLDDLQQELGRPRTIGTTNAAVPNEKPIGSAHLHTVFRYGGKFSQQDHEQIRTRLNNLVEWIKEQI